MGVIMAQTTYGGTISQRTAAYVQREMLKHAEPVIVLQKLALTKPIPQNTADTMKFRRPVRSRPTPCRLRKASRRPRRQWPMSMSRSSSPNMRGLVTVTDKVEDLCEDPVLNNASELLGEQAGATAEQVTYNVVKAGTTVLYANGTARNQVNTAITLNKIRAVIRTMKANKAKPLTRILDASPAYGTSSVEAGYIAVCHTDCEADIRSLAGFTQTADYGSRKTISDYEFGTVENVRFLTSPDLGSFADAGGAKGTMKSTTGTSADVYPILFFGQDAFAVCPLKGKFALTPSVVMAKPSDSDPLAQRSHVGYKFYFAAVILNQTWMARLEVAVTDL
jgi:N4-gp56 family major capsid protein